jgi:hypothetical protein
MVVPAGVPLVRIGDPSGIDAAAQKSCICEQPARPTGMPPIQIPALVVQIGDQPTQTYVPADTSPPDCMPHDAQQHRYLFALVTELGLSREERLSLGEQIVGRDLSTFKHLTAYEADRLISALHGAQLYREIIRQRSPGINRQGH